MQTALIIVAAIDGAFIAIALALVIRDARAAIAYHRTIARRLAYLRRD